MYTVVVILLFVAVLGLDALLEYQREKKALVIPHGRVHKKG